LYYKGGLTRSCKYLQKWSGGNIGYHSIWAASGDSGIKSIDPLATKRESSLGGQMCRNPSTKKTSERIMIVVGSDARKVVMEEFSWWHVKGANIRFNRLEICR